MPSIKSKLITDVIGNEVRNQKFRKEIGISYGCKISYMVMETKIDDRVYYCCWSGGSIENGDAKLTEVGQAALETLVALPIGKNDTLFFQEIKLSKTALKKKIINMLSTKPRNSKVCFVGDLAGELDGHMVEAFNLDGSKDLKTK